jgi:hypothetical protein
VKGYNNASVDYFKDGTFFDQNDNIIVPFDQDSVTNMTEMVKNRNLENEAWKHFNENVKNKLTEKNENIPFEILEPIYWHFLECLPPMYCDNGFFVSEAVTFNAKGQTLYHKITKQNNKFFIQLSPYTK